LNCIAWLFEPFTSLLRKNLQPTRVDFRVGGGRAALILVHGFSGNSRATWSGLIDFVLQEPLISTWDVFALGFPSSLRIDVPEVWAADPNLSLLARELRTTLSLAPFREYQALAIAAHSMGGLVVQRALVDDASLASRVGHAFFFGTPSGGLPKARLVSRLKRQFRDMSPASDFIVTLRKDWNAKYGNNLPFDLRVIAGDRDEFVPSASSLAPFEENVQAVVPGNHLEIVKPTDANHQSVRIVIESLTGGNRSLPPVDSARLAVELGQFKRAVETLLPRVSELDDNAVVSLALALEGTHHPSEEVLQILEKYCRGGISSSEALGVLGGRVKRRWIAKGKLGTTVFGVALGVPLEQVSSGPFGQFQNCGDDEDSLTKLVTQLMRRNPDASPREEAVRMQVGLFREKVQKILKASGKAAAVTEVSAEQNAAKLFEEVKAMVRDLPERLDDLSVFHASRKNGGRFRGTDPRGLDAIMHDGITPEGGLATAWLMLVSSIQDAHPWVSGVGLEFYRALKSRNMEEIRRARREMHQAIELAQRLMRFLPDRENRSEIVLKRMHDWVEMAIDRNPPRLRIRRLRPKPAGDD
jgi:pimeloyl-ACP methyl ester carboxylesterase